MNKFDTADYDEEVLKHLVRSSVVFKKAQEIKLKPEDFLSSDLAGVKLYKHIAAAVMKIGKLPISRRTLEIRVKESLASEGIPLDEGFSTLLDWIYNDVLNEQLIADELKDFAKRRRLVKLKDSHSDDDLDNFAREAAKLAVSFDSLETVSQATSAKPFAAIHVAKTTHGIHTGFAGVDAKFHGLGREEYGLIIGHSGSGKTAVTSAMARYSALNGYKALYISLEEPKKNIIDRWYAAQFRISYSRLHFGLEDPKQKSDITTDLEIALRDLDEQTKESLMNLEIIDARDLCPINANQIKDLIDQKVSEGFIPDVIMVDQLEFMTPIMEMPKQAQQYQHLEQCSKEMDRLSQYKINDEHTFALWLIHQGKGSPKWIFGYDDIAGARGIVRPTDVCLGVGRMDVKDPHVNLFSLKNRHGQPFQVSYRAEFEYMSFIQEKYDPKMIKDAEKEAAGLEKERKKPSTSKKPKDYLLKKDNG